MVVGVAPAVHTNASLVVTEACSMPLRMLLCTRRAPLQKKMTRKACVALNSGAKSEATFWVALGVA